MGENGDERTAVGGYSRSIDRLFGEIAVRQHFVAPRHVRDCLEELERRSRREKGLNLADILVRHGSITRVQRETIEGILQKEVRLERVGPYELVERIGEGGMGTVYKARDPASGRIVAVKVLPPNLAQDKVFMGRFQREAVAVTQLVHPHIVKGLDVGRDGELHYIVMEFIEGLDCDRMLARRGRIPEREAARIGEHVAGALAYAEENELVHRDIKPANIIVMPDGTTKLTDLGLAKSTSTRAAKLTQAGITMGTPHYISPEQAMGASDLDVRSDQYSLGATLYQLVTGRVPFEGTSPAIIVAKHLTEKLISPQDIAPELTDGMTYVLEKMLAKDRDDRYHDPERLVADLKLLASGRQPTVVRLEPEKTTVLRSAEILAEAKRLAGKKKKRATLRQGAMTLVVGVLLGLGIAVGVAVLLLRSEREVVDELLGPRPVPGWTPLVTDGLEGWRSRGPRGWSVGVPSSGDEGGGERFIEGVDPGEGTIETTAVFGSYRLRADVALSEDAVAYLIVGKPKDVPLGGCRLRLRGVGKDRWLELDATVKATGVTAFLDGKPLEPAPGDASAVDPAGGVIAFESKKGTLRFRSPRVRLHGER